MEIKNIENGISADSPLVIDGLQLQVALAQFNKKLDQNPPEEEIEIRKLADGRTAKYLPIAYVEARLYEIFGSFQTRNFKTKIVANEVVGSIELIIWHPVLNQWITQTGSAAVMILQKSGAKPSDLDAKYPNAMEAGAPHLLSDCLVNAAKRLGKIFGRDLNRKHKRDFQDPIQSSIEQLKELRAKKSLLEKSARVLRKYQKVAEQYTSAAELFNNGRRIADAALSEGLLDFDLDQLRAFMRAHHTALLLEAELKDEQNIEAHLPTLKTPNK